MLLELIKLANHLDEKGLYKEANDLDAIIKIATDKPKETYKVVIDDLAQVGIMEVLFEGTREECLAYMRKHLDRPGGVDLIHQGRFSSWAL